VRATLLIVVPLIACGSSSGPRINCPTGTEPEKTDHARGCKRPDGAWHGPFASLHPGGKQRDVGQYDEGVPDGTWTSYGPDGKVLGSYEIVDGTGVVQRWHDNGQLAAEIPYRNGRREGVSRHWHENGQKSSESPMHDDRLHGVARRWSAAGIKLGEAPYEHGRQHGTARLWDESGTLTRETEYFHGTRTRETVYESGEQVSNQTWEIDPPGDHIATRTHPDIDPDWQRCTEHHECELVTTVCCACDAGDSVAVNHRHADQARERFRRDCTTPCPSMLCPRVSGRCDDGRCVSAE
jgi:hypothetical protein